MNTPSDQPGPKTLHGETRSLALQAAQVREALQELRPPDVPAGTLQDLTQLADSLSQIGLTMGAFEAEHSNMLALAEISSVVNSSLELDEVLRVVMDNIVRLTGAERGFLMLRDEKGDMVTRVARNWEQESIESDEAATSRTVVQRVIASGAPIVSTDAQGDHRFSDQASVVALNLRSIVCVPLKAKGELIGVIYADHRLRTGLFARAERDLLAAFANQAAIAIENARLFEKLRRSNVDLELAYDATIAGWSHALDLRDNETEGHSQRVTDLSLGLARLFGLREEELVHVHRGALLHDIGKMGVPDQVLLKAGPLTDDEWVVMKKHPAFAYEMLSPIQYLRAAADIPYCHHEKWDGTGYPRGLKGVQIPLAARIFALVDVWDALTSDRPYRKAWSREKALEYIRSQAGTHFDPQVVKVFLEQ